MPQRLKKWLKRLALLVVVLAVLGIAGFTWIAYWPLEGDVDDLLALVPYDAEFVLRGDWDDLMATGWTQRNLEAAPLHPLLKDWWSGEGEFRTPELSSVGLPAIRRRIEAVELQVNSQIPLSQLWGPFTLKGDVLQGEVAIAGSWCANLDPRLGPPSWQEILVLKRVSWRSRTGLAALSHEFVRDQVVAGGEIRSIEDMGDGILKLVLPAVRVSPERDRAGCGRGFVMPPENEWYVRRVQDVVAVSNSRRMIGQVAELTKEGGLSDSFARRPGFETRLDPRGVVAVANLQPIADYMIRWIDRRQDRLTVLQRFFRPRSLEKFNGGLDLGTPDMLKVGGTMTYVPRDAGAIVDAMYNLAPRPVAEGIATMVPARTTFAAAFLRCDPSYLLTAVYEEAMTPDERRLWQNNLQDMRRRGITAYASVDDFIADVARRMDDTSTIALSRLDAYDAYDQSEWWTDAPPATPAIAIMVKLREGASPAEVDAFLKEKVPLVGFEGELQTAEHRGTRYTKLELPGRTLNERHLVPAYVVVQGHVVLCTSETYLRQILDTLADGPGSSLAEDDAFRVTMKGLPSRGQAAFFVDIEKLTRTPPPGQASGSPQGFLWDQRNEVVRSRHSDIAAIREAREEIEARYPKPMSREQQAEANRAVEKAQERFFARYPEHVETYRRELESLRRLRTVGVVVAASQQDLELRLALTLRQAEPGLAWTR